MSIVNKEESKDSTVQVFSKVPIDPMEEITADTSGLTVEELATRHGVRLRRLTFILDCRIVIPICLLYLLAFLDRINISNAYAYGMAKDIDITQHQFSVALTVFFVPYILTEIPSNILLKRFRPHVWLSSCILLFGLVSTCIGFVQNYSQLVACRFLLGVFESGMFPGCFYLLAMWYRRDEAQKRYSFFFASTSLAGAFGGLIAAAINNIDGVRGIKSWRWLFYIEGAITMFFGILAFFFVADFPEDAKFLSENERLFIRAKLRLDVGDPATDSTWGWKKLFQVFKDWKVFMGGMLYFLTVCPAYGYAYFATSILGTFHYTPLQVQWYSVPPWVTASVFTMLAAILSDRVRNRGGFVLYSLVLGIIGCIILLVADAEYTRARYAAMIVFLTGVFNSMAIIVCWTNMNFAGHHRRCISTAWQVAFGNIGGILATFMYPIREAPRYVTGISLSLAFLAVCFVLSAIYLLGLRHENHVKQTPAYLEKWEKLDNDAKQLLGDARPSFKYSY